MVRLSVAAVLLPLCFTYSLGFTTHGINADRKHGEYRTQISSLASPSTAVKAPPRTGLLQHLLDLALDSPFWKYVLVPQARNNIVKTAESNGIPWEKCKEWIRESTESTVDWQSVEKLTAGFDFPGYYIKPFHAYDDGNLCKTSAYEVEIASCSVGARNFPEYGPDGENAFRGAFESALSQAGAEVSEDARIIDLGCGTGMSTRRLARSYPQAKEIVGIDLSPYFIEIGKQLQKLAPKSFQEGGNWVSSIETDERIEFLFGDASDTKFDPETFDVVNLQFMLHELPPDVSKSVIEESFRILKPGGQLWISEMDFEAPAYAKQRANPLLFSLIRSTEPYLDEYAESIPEMFKFVARRFDHVTIVPATGRHFAAVARKGISGSVSEGTRMDDRRFDEQGEYVVEDTHLKVWESRK